MIPVPSVKNFVFGAGQPPKSSPIVYRCFGRRERVRRVVGPLDLGRHLAVERPEAGLARRSAGRRPTGRTSSHDLALGLAFVSTAPGFSISRVVVGDDVVEDLLALLLPGEDRLVLVGDEHVAGAADEGGGRVAAAARQGDHVLEELGEECLGRRRPRCRSLRR